MMREIRDAATGESDGCISRNQKFGSMGFARAAPPPRAPTSKIDGRDTINFEIVLLEKFRASHRKTAIITLTFFCQAALLSTDYSFF